jgi:hypothetical protein
MPIISETHVVKKSTNETFNKCISWLRNNNGRILETDPPRHIKAKHEKITGKLGHVSVADCPKIIEIHLSQENQHTVIHVDIDPIEKSIIDNYDNRIRIWPVIIGRILLYVGAEIDKVDKDRLFPDLYYRNQIRRLKMPIYLCIVMQLIALIEFIRIKFSETTLPFVIILLFILEYSLLKDLQKINGEKRKINYYID